MEQNELCRHVDRGGKAAGRPAAVLGLLALLGLLLSAPAPERPLAAQQAESAYADGDAEGCLDCHNEHPTNQILRTPHAVSADARSPLGAEQQCETCHGPSQAHLTRLPDGTRPPPGFVFDATVPAEERSAVCLDCHQGQARMHWASNVHQFEDVACTDCHTVHELRDPVLVVETEPQVCVQCHLIQRAEFLRPSRHPVQIGQMASRPGLLSCSDCHNPHGAIGPTNLVRNTINETCYDCHAELRGPFLWEHAPVREDCTTCHTPHGSQHPMLLEARAPWLCQQCHLAQFHPSTAVSGADVPPRGASDLVLIRGCLNCHTQVHGSNHPSWVRLTR
jgi:DmsE family decaheme c-type cytochrome